MERAVILSREGVLQNPLHNNQQEVVIPTLRPSRTFYTSKTFEDSDRALILETLEQARWVVGGPHGAAGKLGLKRTSSLKLLVAIVPPHLDNGGLEDMYPFQESNRVDA